MVRTECARGASLAAGAGRSTAAAGPSPALVRLPASTSGSSQTLPCGTPGSAGSPCGICSTPSNACSRPARPHRCPLGPVAPAPASAETPDRPPLHRSSPDRGRHALGRAHWLVLARTARALRTLVDRVQPLSTLGERGDLDSHPAGLAAV